MEWGMVGQKMTIFDYVQYWNNHKGERGSETPKYWVCNTWMVPCVLTLIPSKLTLISNKLIPMFSGMLEFLQFEYLYKGRNFPLRHIGFTRFENHFFVFKEGFSEILSLCMFSIQEWFLIKRGLWWCAYGRLLMTYLH